MTFTKGDRVSYRNGHGLRGDDYEGVGVVDFIQGKGGEDLLFLEERYGIGSRIRVWAKDCERIKQEEKA